MERISTGVMLLALVFSARESAAAAPTLDDLVGELEVRRLPQRPVLDRATLGPGAAIEDSAPWVPTSVTPDLCTTGREAHCEKQDGEIARPRRAATEGWLSEAAIGAVLRSRSSALRACLQGPDATLSLEIDVAPDGSVADARVQGAIAPSAAACITGRVERLRFPAPSGGAGLSFEWRLHVSRG